MGLKEETAQPGRLVRLFTSPVNLAVPRSPDDTFFWVFSGTLEEVGPSVWGLVQSPAGVSRTEVEEGICSALGWGLGLWPSVGTPSPTSPGQPADGGAPGPGDRTSAQTHTFPLRLSLGPRLARAGSPAVRASDSHLRSKGQGCFRHPMSMPTAFSADLRTLVFVNPDKPLQWHHAHFTGGETEATEREVTRQNRMSLDALGLPQACPCETQAMRPAQARGCAGAQRAPSQAERPSWSYHGAHVIAPSLSIFVVLIAVAAVPATPEASRARFPPVGRAVPLWPLWAPRNEQ